MSVGKPYRAALAVMLAFAVTSEFVQPALAQQAGMRELDEVVVTAQRRAASMQDVPVAVTAASAEDMAFAQVDSIGNIQAISPSIKFDVTNSAANSANIFIRGIGTVGNNRSFEGAVGVFFDGTYRTRSGQAMQNWLDIESLQVLRGPQGTLFGKNTSAGALIINSKAPNPEQFEGEYELSAGNYSKRLLRAAVNTPLTDRMALRVAGLVAERDGYIKDPNGGHYNDSAPRAAKLQFLFEPTDNLSMRLIADYSREQANCCYGQVNVVHGGMQEYIDELERRNGKRNPSKRLSDYEMTLSNDTDQTVRDKGIQLNVEWFLPAGITLGSVTAYRSWYIEQIGMDADFSGADILSINEDLKTDIFSQEFTVSGEFHNLGFIPYADYVFGVYYADEEINADHQLLWGAQAQDYLLAYILAMQGVPIGPLTPVLALVDQLGVQLLAEEGLISDINMAGTGKSYAAFMHWNFDLTEKLGLTLGARYSKDDKTGQMRRRFFRESPLEPFRLLGAQPGPEYDSAYSDEALSGQIALRYQFSDDIMAYAGYSRGYKSGGVNLDNQAAGSVGDNPDEPTCAMNGDCVPNDPRYKSEYIDGYELGLKMDYFNRRARTNIALFYNELKDLQVATFDGLAFGILNSPDATVYGAEMENQFVLTRALTLGFDVTYLPKAEFGESEALDIASLGILSGRRFAQAPEWTGNLSLSIDQPITRTLSIRGRIGAYYSGSQFTNPANNERRDEQTELAANIGVHSETLGMSLSAWCQNCTDRRYPTQHFNSPLQGDVPGFPDDHNAYVSAPKTYGLTLRGHF